ncbi:hypothetical protein DFQ26_002291, partial [Actinomortierella ambigua]
LLADNTTGVLVIPTFETPTSIVSIQQTYATFVQALTVLLPVAKRLIIDVRGNSGGTACLSSALIAAFFPEIPNPVLNFRYSSLEQQLINIQWDSYVSFLTTVPGSNATTTSAYLNDTVSYPNRQYNFTNYLHINCDKFNFPKFGTTNDPTKPYNPWAPENLVILSDGGCGSACATFANLLATKRGVRTVAVGGRDIANRMSFTSFPGGSVVTAKDHFDT